MIVVQVNLIFVANTSVAVFKYHIVRVYVTREKSLEPRHWDSGLNIMWIFNKKNKPQRPQNN